MPTRPEPDAAAAAYAEADRWLDVADGVPEGWGDVLPTEAAVIGFHDPAEDLDRRAAKWTHRLPDHGLRSLALFAAGLARLEADSWEHDEPHIATQAYEARRFLAGDRIIHWAVPWLDAAGRCYPEHRETAHHARDALLEIGDHLRPAPDLGVDPGASGVGEDAYGPVASRGPDPAMLRSLWSGVVMLDATVRSMTGAMEGAALVSDPDVRTDAAMLYTVAVARWTGLADAHPGTALLWRALARRATETAAALATSD